MYRPFIYISFNNATTFLNYSGFQGCMDDNTKAVLLKQQYRFAGAHTAVKICTWTKNSLRDEGVCYKEQFYGIRSHRCVQMSPSVGFCQNQCVFCWRPLEYNEGIEMKEFDDPDDIIERCLEQQRDLLIGFGGNEKVNEEKLKEALAPKHFAISLTGEPTLYPRLNKFIQRLHDRDFSTFVVTNGMEPEALRHIELPTQLYLSVDAPTYELFMKIDRPQLNDAWDRLMRSLKIIKNLKTRTCLRFTMIKDLNMIKAKEWADIIRLSEPTFVELKSYMFVGNSKDRMKKENMPRHHEVRDFAKSIEKYSDYRIIDEHERSRAVLMMKQDIDSRILNF